MLDAFIIVLVRQDVPKNCYNLQGLFYVNQDFFDTVEPKHINDLELPRAHQTRLS